MSAAGNAAGAAGICLAFAAGCSFTIGGGDLPPPPAWDTSTREACLDFAQAVAARQVSCQFSAGWREHTAAGFTSLCDRTRPDTDVGGVEGICIDRVDDHPCNMLGGLTELCPELRFW